MIILSDMLNEITTVSTGDGEVQYENHRTQYYNVKENALVIIDQRVSDNPLLCQFRGRLYSGAFNPLQRGDEDIFFKILDNLHIRCGDWSVLDRAEITDAGRKLLSSVPYLFHETSNAGEK